MAPDDEEEDPRGQQQALVAALEGHAPPPVPRWKHLAQTAFEGGIDALLGALGLSATQTESQGNLLGQLLTAGLPLAAGVRRIAKPIRAHHGSPHDFDQFSMSKIGTGEGAQAYGHGLYLAENPDTAQYYKDALQQAKRQAEPVVYGGQEFPRGTGQHRVLLDIVDKGKDATIADLERSIKFNESYAPDQAALQRLNLEFAKKIDPAKLVVPKGRMYDVDIHADPADFLDWDAPLSQQSSQVQQAIRRVMTDVQPVKLPDGSYSVTRVGKDGSGLIVREISEPTPEAAREAYGKFVVQGQGSDIYREVARARATSGAFPEILVPRPEQASKALKDAGIAGIKYFDQGSRAAGQGTRNYVVFDEKLLEIVKKYGIAGAVSAGLLNEAQARQLKAQGYQ